MVQNKFDDENNTDIHYFVGCGEQNYAFSSRRDLGAAPTSR